MTTWIAAMSAIVLINLLGTMALSVVVNHRIKSLEDDATRPTTETALYLTPLAT